MIQGAFTRVLVLLLGLFATSLPAADPVFYKKLLAEMTEMFRTNPPAALERINDLISVNPSNPIYYYIRGGVRHGFNRPDLAIEDYTRSIELKAPGFDIYRQRSAEWLRLGYLRKALADLDTVADRWPTQAFALWERGVVCYELGDYEKGARQLIDYRRAYEHDVENSVWFLMCQAKVEDLKRARQWMIPADGDQRIPMNQIYALFKGTGTARQVLDAAATAGPRDPADPSLPPAFHAQFYLGLYADLMGNRDSALEYLEAAIELPMGYNIMHDFALIHRDRLLRSYQTNFARVPARLFQPGHGLGNFFGKLKSGGHARVAFLGDSGTADDDSRRQTVKWLREAYPAAGLEQIEATGIATNAAFDTLSFDHDILSKKPDLVFVEIPADDSPPETSKIWKNLEEILRQTWKVDESIDFCLVYTYAPGTEKIWQSGLRPRTASAAEILAEYYDLPSIDLAFRVAELASQKKLTLQPGPGPIDPGSPAPSGAFFFSKDGVHPSAEGGRLYAEIIRQNLESKLVLRKPYHWLKFPFLPGDDKP